jgi:hypothetical protein
LRRRGERGQVLQRGGGLPATPRSSTSSATCARS